MFPRRTLMLICFSLLFTLLMECSLACTAENDIFSELDHTQEIVLPQYGVTFSLPFGFGDLVPHTDWENGFKCENSETDVCLYFSFDLYDRYTNSMLWEKLHNPRTGFIIWDTLKINDREYLIYTSKVTPASWTALLLDDETYYSFQFYCCYPDDQPPTSIPNELYSILSSLRFLADGRS